MATKRKSQGPLETEPIAKSRRIDSNTPSLPASLPSQTHFEDPNLFQVDPEPGTKDPEDHLTEAVVGDAGELIAESVPTPQRFPLTKKNLHRLEMSTNSKGPRTASVQSLKSGTSGDSSRSISTTGEGFENRALDNGVLDAVRSGKQAVADTEVKKKLLASRGSASPTQSQYNKFADRIVEASNEQGTIAVYSKYVFQDTEDAHFDIGYRRKEDKMWTEFPKNVGFNNGLSAPKPDMIEGFTRDSFPPTIEQIKTLKLVRDEPRYVALPHMAVEYKAHEKSLHEAKVQAGYDGAAMVYGRNEALKFIGKADPPRKPAVLTATTMGQEWNVYAHYAHPNDATGKEEYYQCRMAGGSMENLNEYKQGRKVLRNMQDFAREQSSDLRDSMQKDYDENGPYQPSQRSGSKNGSRSVASNKTPSVGSNGSVQQHPRGQVAPNSAPSSGPAASGAPRGSNARPQGPSASDITRQQAAGKAEQTLNKSKLGSPPLSTSQVVPPLSSQAQSHKPPATHPGVPEAPGPHYTHQNTPVPGKPRPSPLGPGGGAQSPTPHHTSIPRTTAARSPDKGTLPPGSSSSSSSGRSSGSTHSASSAEARRHRARDQEEQKDLLRRRSDSPEKDRSSRTQEGRLGVAPKKTSVFGRFGMGKKKGERLGDD